MAISLIIAVWLAVCGFGFLLWNFRIFVSFAQRNQGLHAIPNILIGSSLGLGFLLLANGVLLYQIIEKLAK